MEKLYELLFPNVKIAHLQWITLCLAVGICGLFCFLMYRIYGKFKLLQEANYGQQLYRAAEDSFRQGNPDRYESLAFTLDAELKRARDSQDGCFAKW